MQILFDYVPGMDLTMLGGVHTRNDVSPPCAMYQDRNGVWRQVAANVLRDAHYFSGVRHTLLEQTRGNSCLRSWDLTNASWAGTATTVLNATGIDGVANHATTVSDISGAAFQNKSQNITIANDNATHACQIWIRKDTDETRFPQVGAGLSGGTAVQRRASLNTSTGVFVSANSLGTGTLTVRDGGLWWIVEVALTNNTTGNTILQPTVYAAARTVIGGSDNVAAVGSVIVGHVQAELNATFCTSPIMTTSAAATRAADQLYFTFPHVPQALTVYVKSLELGTGLLATDPGLFGIGGSSDASFFVMVNSTPRYTAIHRRSSDVSSTAAAATAYLDRLEHRAVLSATGASTLGQAINGGSEVDAGASAANALASAWFLPRIYVGDRNGLPGAIGIVGLRVYSGAKTMAELRAPLTYIRFTDAEGTAYLSNERPFPGNRFGNWTPASTPFGQRAARQSDGAETNFRLREDQSVAFEISGIPARLVDGVNPHETALRLKYHLENGGTCVVHTGDAIASSYSPCGILPGTTPQLTLTDRRAIEYTLSLQLLNLAATPSRMVARYAEQ